MESHPPRVFFEAHLETCHATPLPAFSTHDSVALCPLRHSIPAFCQITLPTTHHFLASQLDHLSLRQGFHSLPLEGLIHQFGTC